MKKIEKTPQERGMTASTDLQVVRRVYDSERSPAALHFTSIVKEIPKLKVAPPPPAPAPAPAASQNNSPWGIYSGGGGNVPAPAPAPSPMPGGAPPLLRSSGSTVYLSAGSLITSSNPDYEVVVTPVEFVLQQRWYGPYGEPEWHDIHYVDQVPLDKR